ncbi:hypothetical protein HDU98_008982, partial [Podochytrium sp. JEL0797]
KYFQQMSIPSGSPESTDDDSWKDHKDELPPLNPFKVTCMQIPALANSGDEFDEMTYLVMKEDHQTEDRFFRILELTNLLLSRCESAEDRSRYIQAAEISRQTSIAWRRMSGELAMR